MQNMILRGVLPDSKALHFTGVGFMEPLLIEGDIWILTGSSASGAITSLHLEEGFLPQQDHLAWPGIEGGVLPYS